MSTPFFRCLVPLQLAVLFLVFAAPARAEKPVWTLLGPGSGPRQFRFLTADPQDGRVVYAGGPEGVYRSADRGDTWKRLGGGLGALSVAIDPQDSQVLFAGDKERLHKSADGGQTWVQVHSGVGMEAVAVSPWDGQLVLAGGWQGLYRSADQGDTWQQVKEGVRLTVLAFDPRDPQVVYAGCIEGLYRSADRGLSWDKLSEGNFTQLLIDPRDPQIVNTIAEINQKTAAYRSTDGGRTWIRGEGAPWRTYYNALAMDSTNPSVLYLTAGSALFRSEDNGISWVRLEPGPMLLAVDTQSPSIMYSGAEEWGNNGEVIRTPFSRSQDGGKTWYTVPTHIPVFAAVFEPQNDRQVYASTDRGVYQSGDAGQNWTVADTSHTFAVLLVDPRAPQVLYGGGEQGVYRSDDRGKTWAQLDGMFGHTVSALLADSRQASARIYAVSEGRLFAGGVQGTTWIQVDGGLGNAAVRSLVLAPHDSLTLYAATSAGVYKSDTSGETWIPATVPFDVGALAVGTEPPYPIYASTRHMIYVSEDQGRSWSISTPLPSRRNGMEGPLSPAIVSMAVDPRDSRVIYAATSLDGVYRGIGGGTTWAFFNTGLALFRGGWPFDYGYSQIPCLLFPPGTTTSLWAATDWGLCRIDLPAPPEPVETKEDTTKSVAEKWTSTGPSALLYGGFNLGIAVSALAVDPQDPRHLYAGTSSGQVFNRAPDGTWATSGAGLPGTAILALAVDPQDGQRVYVGVAGQPAIYYTQDGGQNWWPASGNSLFGSVYAVAFDPQHPQTIYGAMNTVLVRTRDGGGTWEKILTVPAQFSSLAVDPRDLQILYAGARDPYAVYGEGGPWESGVYKSEDGGQHWRRLIDDLVVKLALDPRLPNTLYALIEVERRTSYRFAPSRKLIRSEDGGQNWEELDTRLLGTSIDALAVDPLQSSTLYLAAGNRIFKSVNGGENWADLQAGLPNTPVYALAAGAGDMRRLFAATGHGVFSDEGLEDPTLEQAAFPPPAAEVGADSVWISEGIEESVHELVIAPSDPKVMYAVVGGEAGIGFKQKSYYRVSNLYKKQPDGRWVRTGSGEVSDFLAIDPHNSKILYTNGVNKSTDSGRTWTQITPRDWVAPRFATVIAVNPRDPQVICVGGFHLILKSDDGGGQWAARDPFSMFVSFAIDPQKPQTLYAGSVDPDLPALDLLKSDDGGDSWSKIGQGAVSTLTLDWQDPRQIYALIDSALYHSDNRGVRWYPLPLSLEHQPLTALALDWQRSGTLYVAARGQVFRSTDRGVQWKGLGTGLPDTTISVLAVDPLHPQLVYAGTGKGLYSITSGSLITADTAVEESGEARTDGWILPTTTALGQNFPNPFNLQTAIPYQLKTSSVVHLEIFDLQGHRVRILKQGLQPPGGYRLVWDGQDDRGQELASGIYLVRLQVGDFAAVRKALLIK